MHNNNTCSREAVSYGTGVVLSMKWKKKKVNEGLSMTLANITSTQILKLILRKKHYCVCQNLKEENIWH